MILTDTHTHLYVEEFDKDRQDVVLRAIEENVQKFYLPAIDSSHTARMIEIKRLFPENVFLMVGLHPCSVREDFREELKKVEEFMQTHEFCGLGESGLDLYWDTSFIDEQKQSLRQHIAWALEFDKPLILHTRNSILDTIDILQDYKNTGLRGIFHCFSGTEEEARQIISLGFFLGIGGVLTFKNSGLDKVISNIAIDHIVLETDSPYLAPVPFRGKRNESAYLPFVAKKLGEIKGLPLEVVARITTENALKIFR